MYKGVLSVLLVLSLLDFCLCVDKIRLNNRWFVDTHARVKLFRGINAVNKAFPWVPNSGHINLQNVTQLDNLQEWGFNAVRLGVMWSGLKPAKYEINMTYFNEMIKIINDLGERGMYVIIDLHQDMLSTKFEAYDGAPRWLIDSMPTSDFTYPWPFKHLNLGFGAYLTESCGYAFQNLYTNTNGFQDYFTEYWAIVAATLTSFKNVLGYEIINEPWAGDVYSDPLLLLPGHAGKRNLMPLYNRVQDVIRKYDTETIIFYEPVTWGVMFNGILWGTGFNSTPGNDPQRSALSWHYYCWVLNFQPNPLKNDTWPFFDKSVCDDLQRKLSFEAVKFDRAMLGGASFLTEFGVCTFNTHNGTQNTDECEYVLTANDEYFESWTYWDSDFYDENFQINTKLVNIFSRVYPMSTSGLPKNLFYNTTTKLFIYEYEYNTAITAPTEIFIPKHAYPNGFQVSVTSNFKYSFNNSTNVLDVQVDDGVNLASNATQVKVMIMPIVDLTELAKGLF